MGKHKLEVVYLETEYQKEKRRTITVCLLRGCRGVVDYYILEIQKYPTDRYGEQNGKSETLKLEVFSPELTGRGNKYIRQAIEEFDNEKAAD